MLSGTQPYKHIWSDFVYVCNIVGSFIYETVGELVSDTK